MQEQIKRTWYYHVDPPGAVQSPTPKNGNEKLRVLERPIVNDYYRIEFYYNIEYREKGNYFQCDCKKFELTGILCCHIFTVIFNKNIQVINERYVPRRWRKDVHHRHSKIFFAGGYPNMIEKYKKFMEL